MSDETIPVIIDYGALRVDGSKSMEANLNFGGFDAININDLLINADGVINFDSGNVTLTHSAGQLAMAGGPFIINGSAASTKGLQIDFASTPATGGALDAVDIDIDFNPAGSAAGTTAKGMSFDMTLDHELTGTGGGTVQTWDGMVFTVIDNSAVTGNYGFETASITTRGMNVNIITNRTHTNGDIVEENFGLDLNIQEVSDMTAAPGKANFLSNYGLKAVITSSGNSNGVSDIFGNSYGAWISVSRGAFTHTTFDNYGIYISNVTGADNNWGYYNSSAAAHNFMGVDNVKSYFGQGKDASIYYNGFDLVIDAAEVGSGVLSVVTGLKITGNVGFHGTTPVVKQTGTAVVSTGLIEMRDAINLFRTVFKKPFPKPSSPLLWSRQQH